MKKIVRSEIKQALEYIEEHLDDELSIEIISKDVGLSKYHFSRIFKEEIGESMHLYVKRLKVERASVMMYATNQSILSVANHVGYMTPSGFSRVFNSHFSLNPMEYKNSRNQNLAFYADQKITPSIENIDSTLAIYQRSLGSYPQSAAKSWSTLKSELQNKAPKFLQEEYELMGICYDDPSITSAKNLRYDSYIAISKDEAQYLSALSFDIKIIKGGKFASLLHKGDYSGIYDNWMRLYLWASENGYECKDIRLRIRYIKTPDSVPTDQLETQIYIMLEDI